MESQPTVPQDVAASPVVGFILIAAISLVTITVVLLGGGPALERIQADQESDAMVRHMGGLDQAVQSLVSGAPAQTTPAWRISMARGSLSLDSSGMLWAYAVDLKDPADSGTNYELEYRDFHDGDNVFRLENTGDDIDTLSATAAIHNGSSETAVNVAIVDTDLDNGEDTTATLSYPAGGPDVPLAGHTVEVTFFDDTVSTSKPIAWIWFVDTGAVVWSTGTGGGQHAVVYHNSAVVNHQDGGETIVNTPNLKEPRETAKNKETVFLRAVKLNGTLSVAGDTSTTVLLSGTGNHARFSTSNADRLQIYPATIWEDGWKHWLGDSEEGAYPGHGGTCVPCSDGPWRISYDRSDQGLNELAVSFVETTVQLEGS